MDRVAVSTNTLLPQVTDAVNLDMGAYGNNVGYGLDGMMIFNCGIWMVRVVIIIAYIACVRPEGR